MTRASTTSAALLLFALAAALAGCASSVGPTDGRAGDASDDAPSCRLPNGGSCPRGQTCPAGDGCNTCSCGGDVAICTLRACDPPDAQTMPIACASSAQCPANMYCAYTPSCAPNAMGTCQSNACNTLPVIRTSCGCDGMSFTHGGCEPDRPFASMGQCPVLPDGGMESTRFPGAVMVWQAPGGIAGTGPAVVVTADGLVRIYRDVPAFMPTAPPAMPARTLRVTIAQVDDLFTRWFNTPTVGLPHMNPGANECYPRVYTNLCRTCTPRAFEYRHPRDLLPEMENVWRWFDANVPDANPRTFCG